MIVTVRSGTTFAAALTYLLDRDRKGHAQAAIYDTNLHSHDPDELARLLTYIAEQNLRVRKPVLHLVLAFHAAERPLLDGDQGRLLLTQFLLRLGASNVPFVAVRHDEGLHVVAAVIRMDGTRIDTWHIGQRANAAVRTLALRFGLYAGFDPGPLPRPALTRGELEMAERERAAGYPVPPKLQIAARIAVALAPGTSTAERYAANLDRLDVDTKLEIWHGRHRHAASCGGGWRCQQL